MNPKKQMNRRIVLISLMLIFICSTFSLQSTDTMQNPPFYYESAQEPSTSAFEGAARRFEVIQHATAISSKYNINPPTTSSFTLTSGWTADNIVIWCENVSRYHNFVLNGLASLTGWPPTSYYPYWKYFDNDVGGGGSAGSLRSDNRTGQLSLDIGYANMNAGEYAYFYQTVTINDQADSDQMVELTFDYRVRPRYPAGPYQYAYVYAAVIVGGVQYNVTYAFPSVPVYDTWNTVSLQYYLDDEGQSLPNAVTFRFGVYIGSNMVPLSDINDLHFTNIEYNVWTVVNQPNVLRATDNDDSTIYYYQNSAPGMGNFTVPVQKNYVTTKDVIFSISKNPSITDVILIDNLTISADLNRTINSAYSTYQDGAFPNSDDILWSFDAALSIPTSYTNKWIEFEKSEDWQIVSVVDPFLTNRTSSCTNLEYGTTMFIIPSTIYSNGNWQIRARSKSWFDDAKLEFWNGISFEEKTEFYVNEAFHVRVDINNTVTLINTNINFTIFNPNGTVFYETSEEPSSFVYYYGNFTIGISNMSVGMYTAEVSWTNNLTSAYVDKVGYKTFDFSVIHHTQLAAQDPLIETVPGEPLLILVEFVDTDIGEGIDLATVEYNSTFGQTGSLQYIGSGYYFLDLDTSSLDYSDYYLSFNATKSSYVNQTESNLVQLRIEREGMILEVPRQIKTVSANSYALFDFNLTGEISEAYLHPANVSTNWFAPYTITDYNNGTYRLSASTYGVTSSSFPETFIININVNKTNYSDISDVVLLQVIPVSSLIAVNETFIEVSRGTPFSVKVNYTESSSGNLIGGATCTATWLLDTTIRDVGNEFVIDYDTTGMDVDQYTSVIQMNKSGYETKSIIITVLVNPVQTVIAANDTFIRVSQGSQFTVKVNYTEYYGGAIINGASCSVTWIKYYEITPVADGFEILFNTTDLSLDQYTATIKIEKTGYETKNAFITVLVDPISTLLVANDTLIIVYQGYTFSISVNYTIDGSGVPVTGATCSVSWLRDKIITPNPYGFNIEFNTTGLELGQYSSLITLSKSGYETRNLFITILIEPLSSELILLIAEPIEFLIGDPATIALEFLVDSLTFSSGTISLIGDLEGDFVWNGTAYTLDLDTSLLDPKIYFSQIFAHAPGVQTQIYDLYIRIQPVEFVVTLSSNSIIISEADPNIIYITIYDSSHDVYVIDANITTFIDGVMGNIISLGNGTYILDLDQFGLNPAINPYNLHISISNPNGDDETFLITVVVPRNWNLYWWIAGSVAGTALLGLSSLYIYYRYIKQTRFQREVAFIKKNITNITKIKSRQEPTRDKIVLDIINKEIDQLL